MSTLTLDAADRRLLEHLGLAADCRHPVIRRVLLPVLEITATAGAGGEHQNFPTSQRLIFPCSSGRVPTRLREIYRFHNPACPPNLCPRSTNTKRRPTPKPETL